MVPVAQAAFVTNDRDKVRDGLQEPSPAGQNVANRDCEQVGYNRLTMTVGNPKRNQLPRDHARSEPQREAASNIELMQIVAVPYCPAPTPKRVAPVAAIGSGDISW
jgi:hypothetical protein